MQGPFAPVLFFRPASFFLALLVVATPLALRAQDTPPKIDAFEEAVPAGVTNSNSQFRFTYPVRDASSGLVETEQKPASLQSDNRSASDANATMPDPGPPANSASSSGFAAEEAAVDAVGTPGDPPFEEMNIGEGRFSGFPLRFTVGIQEGYNSNVYASENNPTQSAFTALDFAASYAFGSPRLTITTELTGNITYYYAATSENWLPNIYWNLAAEYSATPRLTLGFNTTTAYLTQGSAGLAGAPTEGFNSGYLYSSSGFQAEYSWVEKFSTITTYSPLFLIYSDQNQQDQLGRVEQTIGQQFLHVWRPTTSLVAEYRLNLLNYFVNNDINSWGNYFLGGFNHTLNPGSELVFRAGLQQSFNQIPTIYGGGENTSYNPYGQLLFNNQLGKDTSIGFQSSYGSTASGYSTINQAQQLLLGVTISRNITSRIAANTSFNYQNNFYNQPGYSTPGNTKPGSFSSNVYSASIGLAYRIYRNWSLNASYQFSGTASGNSTQVAPYNQNIASFGVQTEFGGRRR